MASTKTRDPHQIEVPDEIFTERLILRAPRAGDGTEVNHAVRESLDHLKQWMEWATHVPSIAETEALQHQALNDFMARRQFSFNTYIRPSGTFIGTPALYNIDWSVPKLEIGYWLRAGWEGRGLMTEAVRALIDLAFNTLGMERVEIRSDPRNARSTAIPNRLGFALEGVLRNEKRTPLGTLRDTAVYALVRDSMKLRPANGVSA